MPREEGTWERFDTLKEAYPDINLKDNDIFDHGGIDMNMNQTNKKGTTVDRVTEEDVAVDRGYATIHRQVDEAAEKAHDDNKAMDWDDRATKEIHKVRSMREAPIWTSDYYMG